jgi:DNA-directed RNA polymerase specialized sigma24 family protein
VLETGTSFEAFCDVVQPKLRQAFAARYGYADGAEATAEALAYAWEHWERIQTMENPAGYLFRVGRSKTRRIRRPTPFLIDMPERGIPDVEPGLPAALASLSEHQRVAVTLIGGFGWKLREVAEVRGVSTSTVQNHFERGMRKLRTRMGDSS